MWNQLQEHRASRPAGNATSCGRAGTRLCPPAWAASRTATKSATTWSLLHSSLSLQSCVGAPAAPCRAPCHPGTRRGQRLVTGAGGGGGKRIYPCKNCGHVHSRYYGKCQQCGAFGAMPLEGELPPPPPAAEALLGGGRARGGGGAGVQALEQLQAAVAASGGGGGGSSSSGATAAAAAGGRSVGWVAGGGDGDDDAPLSLRALSRAAAAGGLARQGRIPLSGRTGAEVQRVLGGGVVPGALVLLGGDPGVGKSTITLQVAAMMAHPEIDFDALEERRAAAAGSGLAGGGYEGEEEEGVSTEASDLEPDALLEGEAGGFDGEVVEDEAEGQLAGRGRPRGRQPLRSQEGVEEGEEWEEEEEEEGMAGGEEELFGEGEDGEEESEEEEAGGRAVGSAASAFAVEAAAAASPQHHHQRQRHRTVLYVTAEETREQVVSRSRRMGLHRCDRVVVLCRSEMSAIVRAVLEVRPDAVVMDSINTVYLGSLPQAPGTVTQIRECGQLLLRLAKDHRIALFIIGHVTKGGEMAGPNMLAHMVDTVLYLEGDVAQSVRLLRVVKNRHGSDAECGVFSMDGSGLHAVANQSALFLESRMADAEGDGVGEEALAASSVVGVTMQGSRAILVEVQALVSPLGERAAAAASALSYRSATGVDKGRLATLCAILDKHVPTLELAACSVIVNVVGGAQVRDVASDLAITVAIAASYYNVAVPRDLAVCGEVDLAGRVRCSFQRLDVRVREAAKLGFRRVVIPRTKGWERLASDGALAAAGVEVVAVRSVAEALLAGLGAGTVDHRPPHIKPPPRGKPPPGTGRPGSRFTRSAGPPPGQAPPQQQQQQQQQAGAAADLEQEWQYLHGEAAAPYAQQQQQQQQQPYQTAQYQQPYEPTYHQDQTAPYQQQQPYSQEQLLPYQQPPPYIAMDSAWPRAAAMGGVAAAYAAAAAAAAAGPYAPVPAQAAQAAQAYGGQWGGAAAAAEWQAAADVDLEAAANGAAVGWGAGGSYGSSYGEDGGSGSGSSGAAGELEAAAALPGAEPAVEALRPQLGSSYRLIGGEEAQVAGGGGMGSLSAMASGASADEGGEEALEGLSLRQRRAKGRRTSSK